MQVTDISLDHDLGYDERSTGFYVVLWIEEQVEVHSANVSARANMEAGIRAIVARANPHL